MALKIRLARSGSKNRPYYNIVVAEGKGPRDGKFIEELGSYNPLLNEEEKRISILKERAEYWLSKGAEPTDRVVLFLQKKDIGQKVPFIKALNKKLALKVKATTAGVAKKKELEAKKAEASAKKQEAAAAVEA
ncbi:MAG: 30S ribosomal protein S16 [Alphaproteobacteria bacterium]|jgi:small subunit ribosomal protein S16